MVINKMRGLIPWALALALATITPPSWSDEDVCLKCPRDFSNDIVNNVDGRNQVRRKRSFGEDMDFSTALADVIDGVHRFSISFNDEVDFFDEITPRFTVIPKNGEWWEGPNVCVRREEKTLTTSPSETSLLDEASVRMGVTHTLDSYGNVSFRFRNSYCLSSANSFKCNYEVGNSTSKTITSEIHECCQGYARVEGESKPGCNKALELTPLDETMEKLGLLKLKEALRSVGLGNIIRTQNVTVFAPTDAAMTAYEEEEKSRLASYTPIRDAAADLASSVMVGGAPVAYRERSPLILDDSIRGEVKNIEKTILGHLVPGFLRFSSMADEQLVETANGQDKLRINIFEHRGLAKKLVTANCAPVSSADNQATNGIIHVIDRVVSPAVKGTIMDIVAKDDQFGILESIVAQSGLKALLKNEGASLTLFAPTDAAFKKLPPKVLARLTSGRSGDCVRRILEAHIVPSVICAAAVAGVSPVLITNKLNERINASRIDDKIFVGESRAQVTVADVVATNGIVHVIDGALIPRSSFDVLEVARRAGGAAFTKMVESFSKEDELASRLENARNVTIFVPTDEAFEKLTEKEKKDLTDKRKLEATLKHHVVPDTVIRSIRDLEVGENLRTMNIDHPINVQGMTITVWPYGQVRSVQCANYVSRPIEACNGNIILVDKVLIPPQGKLVDVLANHNLTQMVRLLKVSGLADEVQDEGPFTIFAPDDEAFGSMRGGLEELEKDPEMLKNFLRNHIAKGVTCCSMIRVGSQVGRFTLRLPSLAADGLIENSLRLHYFHGLHNFVNHAQILECDKMAQNGVIHVINDVLKPREMRRRNGHPMDSFLRRLLDEFAGNTNHNRGVWPRGFGNRKEVFGIP